MIDSQGYTLDHSMNSQVKLLHNNPDQDTVSVLLVKMRFTIDIKIIRIHFWLQKDGFLHAFKHHEEKNYFFLNWAFLLNCYIVQNEPGKRDPRWIIENVLHNNDSCWERFDIKVFCQKCTCVIVKCIYI